MWKILLVDDDTKIRRVIKRHLSQGDYLISEAGNGEEALCEIEKNIPDLMILDIMMPVMDGLELLKKIKNHLTYKKIFVILFSARARSEERQVGLDLGADDYLSKPFDHKEFLEKVKSGLAFVEASNR